MELLAAWCGRLGEAVRGLPMAALITAVGILLTVRTGFLPFRRFGYVLRNTAGRCFSRRSAGSGAVTPTQAMTTALAATVGTGNIAGVAGAIALGGPGAVFWMWLSALAGMATKFSEITLAVRFRERNRDGDWVGGPMYYIRCGLGRRWEWLAGVFSAFGAAAAFGIGNLAQANTVAAAAGSAAALLRPELAPFTPEVHLAAGGIMAALTGAVLLGGVKRLGAVTERLVPLMAGAYIAAALAVILCHADAVLPALGKIARGAFSPAAAGGGLAGAGMRAAVERGVSRGTFSNEAGLGSAPIAHAAADTDSPVRQGLYGIFEVFADTLVICTLTALAILTSGTEIGYGSPAGAELTAAAFGRVFGGRAAALIVAGCVTLFALSSIFSWGLYGARCAEFLFGPGVVRPYQTVFAAVTAVGACVRLQVAWSAAETLNALMALPNLVALTALSGTVAEMTRAYFRPARPGGRLLGKR